MTNDNISQYSHRERKINTYLDFKLIKEFIISKNAKYGTLYI